MFMFLQAATNTLLGHFLSLICSLWLLSSVGQGKGMGLQVRGARARGRSVPQSDLQATGDEGPRVTLCLSVRLSVRVDWTTQRITEFATLFRGSTHCWAILPLDAPKTS